MDFSFLNALEREKSVLKLSVPFLKSRDSRSYSRTRYTSRIKYV